MEIIEISVQDLAEYCTAHGSIGAIPSVARMLIGTKAHKRLQKQYLENEAISYRAEVPMERTVERSSYSLHIVGRADGIFTDGTDWFVHEIKTTYLAPTSIDSPLSPSHKAQMLIYAYFLCREHDLERIKARLSYVCLRTDDIVDLEYTIDFCALEELFVRFVDDFDMLASIQVKARRSMLKTASTLEFPFPQYRAGQHEGAVQVYSAIHLSRKIMLQAPTGCGKTAMTLFPALKALAAGDGKRILYLCAKNRTQEAAEKTLSTLRANGLKIKSTVIRAKEKMCLQESLNCDPAVCPYANEYYTRLHTALPEILTEDEFSFTRLKELGAKYQLCPYELSLELAMESHVLICDYNYLFDPFVNLKRLTEGDHENIVLIDEAHNLVQRSREMFSASVSVKQLSDIRREYKDNKSLYRLLGKLISPLKRLAQEYEPESPVPFTETDALTTEILRLREYADRHTPLPPALTFLIKDLVRFSGLCALYDPAVFHLYYVGKPASLCLRLFCVDPSAYLKDAIDKNNSTVYFSATISPFYFYSRMLAAGTYGFAVPYPFDNKRLLVLADYSVDTRYRVRDSFTEKIAGKILAAAEAADGTVMVFFPSFAFLDKVLPYLEKENPLVQQRDMDDEAQQTFLDALPGQRLALAVTGSHFAEGVDLRLAGIIIVGVSFPQYNLERELIRQYYDKNKEDGYRFAYVYPGMNRVAQAAGRLIRTAEDRGFLLLLDERFRGFLPLLPDYWNITEVKSEEDIRRRILDFSR